jgi:hypothetical protein
VLIRAGLRQKLLIGLLGVGLLVAGGLGLIYYGMILHKTGQAESLNDLAHNIAVTRFHIVPNYFRGLLARPERISLDIKFKDFQKIVHYREMSLARGIILDDVKQEDIPAKLTYNDETYAVDLQMTGKFLDHLRHPKKWSFQVKVKGDHTLFGMKEFVLIRPEIRGNISEWVCHQLEKREGLISLKYDFIDVTLNGDHLGIYAIEEHFEKRVVESNQRREGILFKPGLQQIIVFNRKKIAANPTLQAQLSLLNKLWTAFLVGDIPASKLFDIDKLAKHYAIADLVNGHHEHYLGNTHYYFNPVTGLIEPLGREWGALRYSRDEVTSLFIEDFKDYGAAYHQKIFKDLLFVAKYIEALDRLSKPDYLDSLFRDIESELQTKLAILYQDNPYYAYPKEFLYRNQEYIRSKLYPTALPVAAYYRGKKDGKIELSVRHLQVLPIKIVNLSWNDSVVFDPVREMILHAGQASTPPDYVLAEFTIPAGVSWSNTIIDQLKLQYKTPGTTILGAVPVFPWSSQDVAEFPYDLLRQDPNCHEFDFVTVDEVAKVVSIKPGEFRLHRDLIIPPGYTFVCRAGVRLNLSKGAKILSYSPLAWSGTEQNPVLIYSADSTGQGLVVVSARSTSMLDHVVFNNLSNPSQHGWELTGALTFYESPVHLSHCQIIGNRSEDGLNIIRSEYTIDQTLFRQTSSDAVDADFANGTITNSHFINCGNDAIDISGSVADLHNIFVDGAGDKGLSAGEDSHVTVTQMDIKNAEIGVGGKDQSETIIEDMSIDNCKIGITVYQKKSEFGPASIKVTDLEMAQAHIPYLVEAESTLVVNNQPIAPSRKNVKEILYGIEYGKSSK